MLKRGDRVFFSDTSEGRLEHAGIFKKVCLDLGLVPVFYVGARIEHRKDSKRVKIHNEARADFYSAKAVVLHLGAGDGLDNWALPELGDALRLEMPILLYARQSLSLDVLKEHKLDLMRPQVVSSGEEFAAVLRQDIENLLAG